MKPERPPQPADQFLGHAGESRPARVGSSAARPGSAGGQRRGDRPRRRRLPRRSPPRWCRGPRATSGPGPGPARVARTGRAEATRLVARLPRLGRPVGIDQSMLMPARCSRSTKCPGSPGGFVLLDHEEGNSFRRWTLHELRHGLGRARRPSSRSATCSAMGISTSYEAARSTTGPLVSTPSATMRISAITSARERPRPNASPSVRLRLFGLVQVATRSPTPANPPKVVTAPPSSTPTRAISARPRVIERGTGVVAETQAVTDARGDGQHVSQLRRSRSRPRRYWCTPENAVP